MTRYVERSYRRRVHPGNLVPFRVAVQQTDLWVAAARDLSAAVRDLVLGARHQLETYIERQPAFRTALTPLPPDPMAPPLVKAMLRAGAAAGVGPMAAVAGAIAQHVGEALLYQSPEVIVENGGDIFLKLARPGRISILAGDSPLSERLGLLVPVEDMPLGIGASSARIGHSLSLGAADLACVMARSAARADAAATALGNRIRGPQDLARIQDWLEGCGELMGGFVILGGNLAAWGRVQLFAI